jgi:Zn-dependent alcohol dehydrogenase
VLLTNVAGTVGGTTTAGAAAVLATAAHTPFVDVVIAGAGAIGAFVAVLSYWTGRKKDPTAAVTSALVTHSNEDVARFDAQDRRFDSQDASLEHITSRLDTIVEHFIGGGSPPPSTS